MVNWSQMPVELLEKIVGNLDEIADRIIFGAVCKQWRSALQSPILPRVRLPWVLLSPIGDDKFIRFCSISNEKTYSFDHPINQNSMDYYTCSSDSGWLPMISCESRRHVPLLFNPITGAHISLPKLPHFDQSFFLIDSNYISISPKDESFVVMVSFVPDSLFCYRSEASSWTSMEILTEQFTYHRGHYFILGAEYGSTAIVDPDTNKVVSEIPPLVGISHGIDDCKRKNYLVQSTTRDELFMVVEPSMDFSKRFEVFRWDSAEQENRWIKVKSIGSNTLFKGDADNSTSIMALPRNNSRTPIRENCIVFFDESDNAHHSPLPPLSLFDIADDSVEQIPCYLDPGTDYDSLQWFLPVL